MTFTQKLVAATGLLATADASYAHRFLQDADCSAEQDACFAAPDCLAAMMSSQPSCGAPPVSRSVNAPPSLPALTARVSRGSDGLTERRVLHAVCCDHERLCRWHLHRR